jgi:hypothetical protein
MTNQIFTATVRILEKIGKYTKCTYNQVNVVVWYFILPTIWLIDINKIAALVYTAFCIGIYVGCNSFKTYCNNVFNKSVGFLLHFIRYRISYELSSIIFCLIIPAIICIILLTT